MRSRRIAAIGKVLWVLGLMGAVAAFAASRLHRHSPPHLIAVTPAVFRHFNEGGVLLGHGADTAIMFSRYNCEYCAAMLRGLDSMLTRNPDALTIRLRHFTPPESDSDAFLAAVAADCAAEQGSARSATLWLTNNFDEFALTHGRSMPTGIATLDTAAFFKCTASDEARFHVVTDIIAAVDLKVTGTPTTIVRRYRINGIETSGKLAELARRR